MRADRGVVGRSGLHGRAMAGLIDLIRAGEFKPGQNVLFWHTGGTPALFAYAEQLTA